MPARAGAVRARRAGAAALAAVTGWAAVAGCGSAGPAHPAPAGSPHPHRSASPGPSPTGAPSPPAAEHRAAGRYATAVGTADPATLRSYVRLADRAVPRVTAVWGPHWARHVTVAAYRSEAEAEARLGAERGTYRDLAAVTVGESGAEPGVPAGRIVVNPDAFARLSETGRRVVMVHEAMHVASASAGGPRTPRWLSEGLADYAGYRGSGLGYRAITAELRAETAAHGPPRALPADGDLAAGRGGPHRTGRTLAAAYESAWTACRKIARDHGQHALVALYRATGAGRPLDAAMRTELGTSLRAFTAAWSASLRAPPG